MNFKIILIFVIANLLQGKSDESVNCNFMNAVEYHLQKVNRIVTCYKLQTETYKKFSSTIKSHTDNETANTFKCLNNGTKKFEKEIRIIQEMLAKLAKAVEKQAELNVKKVFLKNQSSAGDEMKKIGKELKECVSEVPKKESDADPLYHAEYYYPRPDNPRS